MKVKQVFDGNTLGFDGTEIDDEVVGDGKDDEIEFTSLEMGKQTYKPDSWVYNSDLIVDKRSDR